MLKYPHVASNICNHVFLQQQKITRNFLKTSTHSTTIESIKTRHREKYKFPNTMQYLVVIVFLPSKINHVDLKAANNFKQNIEMTNK